MERDDKIALGVVGVVLGASSLITLFTIRWFFAGVLGVIDLGSGGIGWGASFWISVFLSVLFVVLFALIAGDGVVGEFSFMMVSFFVLLAFFTVSIALII